MPFIILVSIMRKNNNPVISKKNPFFDKIPDSKLVEKRINF